MRNNQNAIYEHLLTCEHYNRIINLNKINVCQTSNNTTVIDKANKWNILLFKEVCMAKTHRPSLNCGLKA